MDPPADQRNGPGPRSVHWPVHPGSLLGPIGGLAAQVVVLAALEVTVGLGAGAWVLGLGAGCAVAVLLHAGLARRDRGLGPADRVTLGRSTLVGGVLALAVEGGSPWTLVLLAAVALSLDLVDGQVARRTGTVSELGARFDMEVDALLVLVLSCHVAVSLGAPWVLLIGLARYLKLLAAGAWPWLHGTTPPRRWAKVVAAVQGVVLVVAAAGVLPPSLTSTALGIALVLLAASFADEVHWLWRHRTTAPRPELLPPVVLTGLAWGLVVSALLLPSTLDQLHPSSLLQLPVELVAYLAVVLVLPARLGRLRAVLAWGAGIALGLLAVLKALDLGFRAAFARPFDPLVDWRYAGSTVGFARDSTGPVLGTLLVAGAAVAAAVLVGLTPVAVRRVTRAALGHRRVVLRGVATLTALWLVLAAVDVHVGSGRPVASAATAGYAYGQVARVPAELRAQRAFARAAEQDPLASVPAADLLTGLRGKDVLLVFVESYGRVAVQGTSYSPGVEKVLATGTERLEAAGFSSRSAFLTSPTFGGLSWLAHATVQTGLWVDDQHRYDTVVDSPRMSLSRLFGRAGWRTVADVPANTEDWPQAAFYSFDEVYDARNVGYEGPRFGYPTMPDQFTLEAFWRHELAARDRPPVMAEIDLISSHAPWSRTPRMVDRELIGDGSVFDGMPEGLPSEPEIWTSTERVRKAYGHAVEYSLACVVEFVAAHGDEDLVVVLLGDHQPATVVSGTDAGHDVPVSVIASDDAVLERIAPWGWGPGLEPADDAPVWRMDAFRDEFVAAFGPERAHWSHADR